MNRKNINNKIKDIFKERVSWHNEPTSKPALWSNRYPFLQPYSNYCVGKMAQMRSILSFLIISLLFLSQSRPSSANVGFFNQFNKALDQYQHQSRQFPVEDHDLGSLHNRKLRIHIKRRARFGPRGTRPKSSSIPTQISSIHLIGSVLGYSLFLCFFLL